MSGGLEELDFLFGRGAGRGKGAVQRGFRIDDFRRPFVGGNAAAIGFARCRDEHHLPRPGAAQVVAAEGNPFTIKPFPGELGVALANGEADGGDDVAAAEGFGNQLVLAGAFGEQGVEQHFHGVVAGQNLVGVLVAARAMRGQQEMIHAADAHVRVVQANRDAGTQQRGQGTVIFRGPAAWVDVEGNAFQPLSACVSGFDEGAGICAHGCALIGRRR